MNMRNSSCNKVSNMELLGKTGEKIVVNLFSRQRHLVEYAINNFDSTKDIDVEGKKNEIKTQVPFYMKNAFTFKRSQLRKCLNVDSVIFVTAMVPGSSYKHFSDGKVYMIESKELSYSFYTTKDGREMVIIPINQPNMIELYTMTEEENTELCRYTGSTWK